ncbi:hypothetical protein [Dyadobacter psychrotolerans]|uniref:Uncharacterized protein n=1 Tax=Dyadobacter psychrotolerans TaxID=2541721 RepID=A0A4R5DE70_9BACT|nr:hypothetical protein [Dyadobacter psychrotolerans]TDE12089.1 hypothetical protein E0F88_23885 [Dyadobacter psychrotolerans]
MLSCKSKDSSPLLNDNFEAIYQQFHGKYKIVSSVSSEPLDINLDGSSSSDLLTEIDELTTGTLTSPYLQIAINRSSKVNVKPSYLFIQAWPEQFVRMGSGKVWDGTEMIPFHPDYSFAYDMKVVFREFEFSKDRKNLTVKIDDSEKPLFSQSAPNTVTVLNDGKLVVVANRKIYTSLGVKQVTVTTTTNDLPG